MPTIKDRNSQNSRLPNQCKLLCCRSCTFCNKICKAAAKERLKSSIKESRNKVCELCFFCRSVCFCPICSQCPQYSCSLSRRLPTALLADLGPPGCKSESGINFEGGLCPPIQTQTPSNTIPPDSQWLCTTPEKISLREAIQTLLHKKAIEMVMVRASLAFFNRLFIVPKPNKKWRPISDLSALNKCLSVKTFKMETPETIRISLQQGEWVISLDFSDAYFHIPIHTGSRKCLRFHFQNQSYQFRALPFGLSTALMEFTCVVKEVKLMAQSRGIRIHQYLDDWLIRAPTKESCHQGTQSLLALCQELGWVVNLPKSWNPNRFSSLWVTGTISLKDWSNRPRTVGSRFFFKPSCQVRKFMSLIGLLTATEKQVPLGRLHMRPILWHLKRHWRFQFQGLFIRTFYGGPRKQMS